MSNDLRESSALGRMNRRAFMGHASALGLGAAAGAVMPAIAWADDAPVKGGTLRAGASCLGAAPVARGMVSAHAGGSRNDWHEGRVSHDGVADGLGGRQGGFRAQLRRLGGAQVCLTAGVKLEKTAWCKERIAFY